MEETIYCGSCKQQQPFEIQEKIFKNGMKHIQANCMVCGRFLKYIKQEKPIEEMVMFYGKYKGTKLIDIPIEYLSWLKDNCKPNLEEKVGEVLNIIS